MSPQQLSDGIESAGLSGTRCKPPRLVRCRWICGLLAALGFVPPLATWMPAAAVFRETPWVGSVRCELQVEAPGYLHQETHLWALSAGRNSRGGTENLNADCPWTVTGQGWLRRKSGPQTFQDDWTINGQSEGLLNFQTNATTGVVTLRVQPPIPTSLGALTGTTQIFDREVARQPIRLVRDVQAWVFDPIQLRSNVSGGMANTVTREIKANLGPSQPPEAKVTVTISWSFGPSGSTPPGLPPPTLTPRAPSFPNATGSSASPDSSPSSSSSSSSTVALEARVAELERRVAALEAALAARPSSGTGTASTPGSNNTPTPIPPAIVSVMPAAAEAGTTLEVAIVGNSTHFATSTTQATFGAGVGVASLTVTSPTTAKAILQIDRAAAIGPRTVVMSMGNDWVQLSGGFTVQPAPVNVAGIGPIERKAAPEPTPKIDKGRYRVTGTRVQVADHFAYANFGAMHLPPFHGRDNEIFVTSETRVFDRRNGTQIGDRLFRQTPIHGDVNNSDAIKGIRVNAGTYAPSGGIITGDNIILRRATGSDVSPFVIWEGELTAGIEFILVRPAVWVVHGYVDAFWLPYINRLVRERGSDLVNLSAIRAALTKPGVSVDLVPELVNYGRDAEDKQDKPFGQIFNGADYSAPGTWTDRVIVLTREKLETFLAQHSGPADVTLELTNKPAGNDRANYGRCTLYLRLERLP